jgi:hypothetical protein
MSQQPDKPNYINNDINVEIEGYEDPTRNSKQRTAPPKQPAGKGKQRAQAPTEGPSAVPAGAPESDVVMILRALTKAMSLRGKNQPIIASQLPPYPQDSIKTFNSTNITALLESYKDMSKYYELSDKTKVDQITAHFRTHERSVIQAIE